MSSLRALSQPISAEAGVGQSDVNKPVADMTALGRAGVPDDIGPMIAALLSEDNRWVNAQRIEVSGGMSI
jgi:NAD(P)-dependent dehydrogenase (short-subunit alcohol dehydrogenase family)